MKRIFFLCLFAVAFTFASIYADTTHVVAQGETLYAISRKYQLTVAELRAANNMSENDVLKAGQKIIVPTADITSAAALAGSGVAPDTAGRKTVPYKVQKGDTFYGIARKNNMSLSELFAMNGLGNDAVLKAGQELLVPAPGTSSSARQPTAGTSSGFAAGSSSGTSAGTASGTVSAGQKLPDLQSADPRTYASGKQSDSLLVWPVKSPSVTYVKGKVSGVQLSAKKDEAVTAIRAGTVMYCGTYRGFGQVVFVQSKTGLIYAYTGLGSINVKKGDYVVFGAELGIAGVDTISHKSQLTLMVFQNGQPIDPAKAPRG